MLLFAEIYRREEYESDGQHSAILISIIIGFVVATLRNFTATDFLRSQGQSSAKRVRELRGDAFRKLSIIVIATIAILAYFLVHLDAPVWLAILLSISLPICCHDVDLLLAWRGRQSRFSFSNATGNLIAVCYLLARKTATADDLLVAISLPWLCTAACSYHPLARIYGWPRVLAQQTLLRSKGPSLFGALSLSVYDGVILNLPIVADSAFPQFAGGDYLVSYRAFISGLFANSALQALSVRKGWSFFNSQGFVCQTVKYSAVLILSMVIFSTLFIAIFWYRGNPPPSTSILAGTMVLILSYALYSSYLRFGVQNGGAMLPTKLLLCILVVDVVLLAVNHTLEYPQTRIAPLQALALAALPLYVLFKGRAGD